jgi:hypothetical protein
MSVKPKSTSAQRNRSIRIGFELLEILARSEASLTTGEIAKVVGLAPSIISRNLLTLNTLGYVTRIGHGRWRVHTGVLALGALGLRNSPLGKADPIMAQLASQVGCLAALGFVWNQQVVYLFRRAPEEFQSSFGNIYPAQDSVIGLLLQQPARVEHYFMKRNDGINFGLALRLRFDGQEYGIAVSGPMKYYRGDKTLQLLHQAAGKILGTRAAAGK